MPLGVAGPIRVNGEHAQGSYYVPFATSEGAPVSTYQYAITEAGGANVHVHADSPDITPCFELAGTHEAIAFAQVVNASIGWSDAELVGDDDLYVLVRLPILSWVGHNWSCAIARAAAGE